MAGLHFSDNRVTRILPGDSNQSSLLAKEIDAGVENGIAEWYC